MLGVRFIGLNGTVVSDTTGGKDVTKDPVLQIHDIELESNERILGMSSYYSKIKEEHSRNYQIQFVIGG